MAWIQGHGLAAGLVLSAAGLDVWLSYRVALRHFTSELRRGDLLLDLVVLS